MSIEDYKYFEEKYVIDRSYYSIFIHNFLSNLYANPEKFEKLVKFYRLKKTEIVNELNQKYGKKT